MGASQGIDLVHGGIDAEIAHRIGDQRKGAAEFAQGKAACLEAARARRADGLGGQAEAEFEPVQLRLSVVAAQAFDGGAGLGRIEAHHRAQAER